MDIVRETQNNNTNKVVAEEWQALEVYLRIDKKLAAGSIPMLKSRYYSLCEAFKDTPFTRDTFNQFILSLQDKKLKNGTVNGYIKIAKHVDKFFKFNVLQDYTYFKESRPVVEFLTKEEIELLAQCQMNYPRDPYRGDKMRLIIYFLAIVGSRIGETLQLTKKDLINSPLPCVHFRAETTKTQQERYCPIPQWLYDGLQALPDDTLLFGVKDDSNIQQDLKLRAEKVGIKKRVYLHLFRHSSIMHKLNNGMPLFSVAKYHGHSSTDTTYKFYTTVALQEMADTLSTYDPFFKQSQTFEMVSDRIKKYLEKFVDSTKYSLTIIKDSGTLNVVVKPLP